MKTLKSSLLILSIVLGLSFIQTTPVFASIDNVSNEELGGNDNGFYYGLLRGANVLSHQGKYSVLPQDIKKTSNTSYVVKFTSNKPWANGEFIVDILPWEEKNQKVLDGYQVWFGFYNKEHKPIGCGQMKKVK